MVFVRWISYKTSDVLFLGTSNTDRFTEKNTWHCRQVCIKRGVQLILYVKVLYRKRVCVRYCHQFGSVVVCVCWLFTFQYFSQKQLDQMMSMEQIKWNNIIGRNVAWIVHIIICDFHFMWKFNMADGFHLRNHISDSIVTWQDVPYMTL